MKRSLALLIAGLAAAATTVGAAGPTTAADPEAQSIAHFWLDGDGANMRAATPLAFSPTTAPLPSAGTGGFQIDNTVLSIPPRGAGKVYFVGDDDAPHWCTGTVVSSQFGNVVATSGRCAFADQDDQHENWAFVPDSYARRGTTSIYVAQELFAPYDFTVYEDFDQAVAFAAVHDGVRLSGGELRTTGRLADATGAQTLSFTKTVGELTVRLRGHSTGWSLGPWIQLLLQGGQFDQTFATSSAAIKAEELRGVRGSNPVATSLGTAWFSSYENRTRTGTITGFTLGVVADSAGVAVSLSPRLGPAAEAAFDLAAAVPNTPIV